MPSTKSRRLRKKLYLDEFAMLGFKFSCTLDVKTADEFDLLLNQLVDFIESQELSIEGGGDATLFSALIYSNHRYTSATNENIASIKAWLEKNEAVADVTVSELIDANYGA
jgi:uncharacterized protein YggL (DUF469 family)